MAAERRAEQLRRWNEARERFERRAGSVRTAAAPSLGVNDPDRYELARVPYLPNRVTRLPAPRRAAYVVHLRETVARAFTERASGTQPPGFDLQHDQRNNAALRSPAIAAVLERGCAQCRGACCPQGGTRAFVDVPTIARYLVQHPTAAEEDVVNAYLAYLGTRTIAEGCVNQGARGCTLPREMRAAICNKFLCDGLSELVGRLVARDDHQQEPRVFYQAGVDDEAHFAFVDLRDVRVVRRRASESATNTMDADAPGS